MTFFTWLFDPRTIIAIVVLIPVAFGWVSQKSMQVVVASVGVNMMWLVGAQLNLRLTGIATAVITIVVGTSMTLYLPLDMLRRRRNESLDPEIGPDEPLLAIHRYGDLSTPVIEVVMLFSGQTMLIALYMNEMCRQPHWHDWFNSALWTCGWVGQMMAYTQFGFDFKGETSFWRRLLPFSGQSVRIKKDTKASIVEVDAKELAFRSILSCLVNVVYRVFMWMSLPIYIARGHGGLEIVMKCVAVMYILCLSDLPVAARIESPEAGEISDFKRSGDNERQLLPTSIE